MNERRPSQDLNADPRRKIADHAECFTLFAALRRLEQAGRDQPRIGTARRPADDVVRISQSPHLFFAPTETSRLTLNGGGKPLLEQFVFGIFGPNGALPLHLTEYVDARDRQHGDATLRAFINLFQHRMSSLFYRAWAEADPCTHADRAESDGFRLYLGALLGIGPQGARDCDSVVDYAKLSRIGLLGLQSRSTSALEQALSEYFEIPVRIVTFCGEWLGMPTESLCWLAGGGERTRLGGGATLGDRTWQRQSRFEIVLGPLPLQRFATFLPGARGISQLRALVRLFTNDEWSWHVRLLLDASEIPAVRLAQSGWLGWTTWLGGTTAGSVSAVIEGSQPVMDDSSRAATPAKLPPFAYKVGA